ncbi:MAG: phosphatidate cytidylyltransferase [Cryomorphaceae bacterium]|nr:phosphatidate cytidylyltransferase [Cryomorphaceae bacterium]
MSNFWQRALTGIVFVSLLIAGIFAGPIWISLLAMLFALVGYNEFVTISRMKFSPVKKGWGFLSVFTIALLSLLFTSSLIESKYLILGLVPLFVLPLIELFGDSDRGFERVVIAIASVVWIAIPFACLPILGMVTGVYQPEIILGFFCLLWINDTGAYLVGRSMGKHKLMPQVSPGKTWEGFIGGVALSLSAAFFLSDLTNTLEVKNWIAIALIISVFSNAGDLVESLFKRNMGVKDSGNFLPGHGGVLDRFDGILLSVPVILAYLLSSNL